MKETGTVTKERRHLGSGPAGPTERAPQQAAPQPASVPTQRLGLSGDAASLREARRLIDEATSGYPPALHDAAVLLVGEVVTNAVLHGGGWFLLEVDTRPDRIRVEVTDSTPGSPRVMRMTDEREHGRGMAIVDALATAWGTDHLGSHKVVWFELSVDA